MSEKRLCKNEISDMKMTGKKTVLHFITTLLLCSAGMSNVQAALTVDRSRLIFNEGDKSVSINITNKNLRDPYLAQGWIEDQNEEKVSGPLMVLPPVQRVEPGAKTLVRIQGLPDFSALPKDRESVFYFNLREIPPKSDMVNTLTLSMQTRLKVFYRPSVLKVDPLQMNVPGAEKITLEKKGDKYVMNNPTGYYFSFVEGRKSSKGKGIDGFEPVMVAPFSNLTLPLSTTVFGSTPVLMFINDYGSQRLLSFSCNGSDCRVGDITMVPLPTQSNTINSVSAQN